MDEAAAVIERRTIEAPGGVELSPLGGQQDLVDQHSTTVAGWASQRLLVQRREADLPPPPASSYPVASPATVPQNPVPTSMDAWAQWEGSS